MRYCGLRQIQFFTPIFFLLLLCAGTCVGQGLATADSVDHLQIPIEQISISAGLSQGMINDVVEDHDGYLWIATKDGLNRYDGVGFKVFRHDPNDTNSIAESFIASLLVDRKNRLWVGTQSKGVDLFDPATERFIHFRHDPNNTGTLSSDMIGILLEDNNGNIVVETLDSVGFNLMTELPGPDNGVQPRFRADPLSDIFPSMLNVNGEDSWHGNIVFDREGILWYYRNGYIVRNEPGRSEAARYAQPKVNLTTMKNASTLVLDRKKENLYTTDRKQTIRKYDSEKQEFVPYLRLPQQYSAQRSIFIDNENTIWIWQPDGSVLRVDLTSAQFVVIEPDWNRLEKMARNHTGISLQDKHGNYWLGTGGNGLLKITSRFDRFKKIADGQTTILGSTRLFRTVKSNRRAVFDKDVMNRWPTIEKNLDLAARNLALSASNNHLVMDNDGMFWIGGHHPIDRVEYLLRIDPTTNSVTRISEQLPEGNEWYAMPVFLDGDNNVWFGEKFYRNSSRLFRYDRKTAQLDTFVFPVKVSKMQYRFISDWYQQPNGVFWFATTHGVFSFDPKSEDWQTFRHEDGDPAGLSNNMTLSICPDPVEPTDILWIGTEGGGLNRLDISTGKIRRFNTGNGLPNDVIYAIQSDPHNNLWISTNQGLCLFSPVNFSVRTFTTFDGLPGNEFNRYEYGRTDEGILCFGGTSGVVYFDPEDFYGNEKPSKVVINRLSLFNDPVAFAFSAEKKKEQEYVLPAPVQHCKKLIFNHNDDMITLGFSTLDLTAPQQNRFRYRLEGLNDDWIEAGTEDHATYTDLAPGRYTFMVVGSNSANVWSTEPTTLQITVLPPWWGTWWARGLMALLLGGILYSFYRYRLGQMLEMERMRNRIAQDLHDEIGSTLSSISLYATVLQTTVKDLPEKAHGFLNRITESTTEMMESMNDMVWSIKADNDSFEHVVDRMRAFAVNMTEARNVELNFDADKYAQELTLNMDRRKNIYLIFKEAVNNAMKYSEADVLRVNISVASSKLKMVIRDNGKGFDKAAAECNRMMGGNGLKGMTARAKELNAELSIASKIDEGTEVYLSIPI